MKAFIFIRDIFKRFPLLLAANTLLQVFVGIVEAGSVFAIGPLVDFLIHPDLTQASPLTVGITKVMSRFGLPVTVGSYLILFAVVISLAAGLRILARFSILKTKYALCRDIMLGTFSDFFRARWYFFSSSKQGELINTFSRELTTVGDAFGSMALLFTSILRLGLCLAIPFYISWQVTSISLVIVLLLTLPFIVLGKISYKLGRLNTSTANRIGVVIQESLSLAKDILGFGNQNKSADNLSIAFDAHREVTIKSQTINQAIPILYRPLGVIVLGVAVLAANSFGVALSETAVLLVALVQVVMAVGNITASKNLLDNFFPSFEQVQRLRNRAKKLEQRSGDKVFTGFNSEISISNLSFAYPGGEPVLSDINMSIPKGKMVAIVGESGAGKSTLIDVLMGFNEPVQGGVKFDDIGLSFFEINSYRHRLGYVPQDTVLFNMSIGDNLLWARKEASYQEIKYACQQANAHEFIKEFSSGYDTLVGDRGVRLSGGQRQRIALARAILRQPELLILDEATSSLDTHSERLIQQAIENIAKETTIIVIAHRLSTIVNADYIYVLGQGRIIEQGKYCDLAKLDGYFNRMVKLQLLETA